MRTHRLVRVVRRHREYLLNKKSGKGFRVGIFLDFVRRLGTTRMSSPMGVHRTCGGANGIELAAIGVKLDGSRRVLQHVL